MKKKCDNSGLFFFYNEKACLNMIESGKGSDVKWGNELGFIILPFHIGLHDDPLQYVRKAKKIVDRKKSSLEVVFTHLASEVILKIFGLKVHMPSWYLFFRTARTLLTHVIKPSHTDKALVTN